MGRAKLSAEAQRQEDESQVEGLLCKQEQPLATEEIGLVLGMPISRVAGALARLGQKCLVVSVGGGKYASVTR